MAKNTKAKGHVVVEMCFPYFKGSTDEWFAAYGPGPREEVLPEFFDGFRFETGQAIGGGVQNGDRLYRIRNLDTDQTVLLLGPTATVKVERVGEKAADGSYACQHVPSDAEATLRAAAIALVAEQSAALRAAAGEE